jgi:E3 ubiquitin-protein ligase RNF14
VLKKFLANGNRGAEGCSNDETEDEFCYNCNFEFLPPLILACLLPKSYPSKDPPYFTVTAKWMDWHNVSQLCEVLDTIWSDLPGQEVVYQWVEWIHNSSLSHLWFDRKIMLGKHSPTNKEDIRAISRSLPLESVIPLMLGYSRKKRHQAFLEEVNMCMICLNQSKGKTVPFSKKPRCYVLHAFLEAFLETYHQFNCFHQPYTIFDLCHVYGN